MKNDSFQKELINKAKEVVSLLKSRAKQEDDNTLDITSDFRGNIVRGTVSGNVTSNISNRDQ